MLDKVDVQIPDGTPAGPCLAPLLQHLRHRPSPPFRPSRFYQHVGDLRKQYEVQHDGEFRHVDAIVSLYYRYGRATHKVEIVDAGKKSLTEMANIVCTLFDIDPWKLRIMRVDLAADIDGVPVYWFRNHARVNRKQFSSRIAKSSNDEVEFVSMGTATAQTLYAGKRPNLIRIYDKIAEWRRSWLKLERASARFNAGMRDLEMSDDQKYYGQRFTPTFEKFCRSEGFEYLDGAAILTRVERQIGGDRVPEELATLGALRNAAEYEPFQTMRLLSSGTIRPIAPPPANVSVGRLLNALGFETLKQELGSAEQACAYVMKHGKGNGKRILESLQGVFPHERQPLTLYELHEAYRKSTLAQVTEPRPSTGILTPYVWQSESNYRKQHSNFFEKPGASVVENVRQT